MVIYAFDPGDTTGIVAYKIGTSDLYTAEVYVVGKMRRAIDDAVMDWPMPNIFVAEDFVLRPGKIAALTGSKLYALRVLGVLEWKSNGSVVLQPASIKQAWPDDRLIQWCGKRGVQFPASKHVRDALRHLLHYAHRTNAEVTYR